MQTLESITQKDTGNSLAHYYLGMCYTQVGNVDKATAEYDMVVTLSPNSELATNAKTGKNNLKGLPPEPTLDKIITPVVNSVKGFLSDEANEKIQEKNIKTIIENVNNKRENSPAIYNRIQNLEPKKSSDNKPTPEQIVEAMQVLKNAGFNLADSSAKTEQLSQINPEMMQMNMLMSAFGGGNNMNGMNSGGSSSMNNMMPMLMMMQNGQGNNKVDPETLQVMMSQMMMPNMMGLYDNNNNSNNY